RTGTLLEPPFPKSSGKQEAAFAPFSCRPRRRASQMTPLAYRQKGILMLRTCGLVIAVALLVGACGGGGSSSSPSVTTVDPVSPPQDLRFALVVGEVGVPY